MSAPREASTTPFASNAGTPVVTSERAADGPPPDEGFTILELLLTVTVIGIVLAVGVSVFEGFRTASTVDKAARVVAADVTLARNHALQRRATVSMVVDEAARSYAIRDESVSPNDTLLVSLHDAGTDAPLTTLNVVSGNSLTFNARGVLSGGGATIDVEYRGEQKRIAVSGLGRTRIITP